MRVISVKIDKKLMNKWLVICHLSESFDSLSSDKPIFSKLVIENEDFLGYRESILPFKP